MRALLRRLGLLWNAGDQPVETLQTSLCLLLKAEPSLAALSCQLQICVHLGLAYLFSFSIMPVENAGQ